MPSKIVLKLEGYYIQDGLPVRDNDDDSSPVEGNDEEWSRLQEVQDILENSGVITVQEDNVEDKTHD